MPDTTESTNREYPLTLNKSAWEQNGNNRRKTKLAKY